MKALFFAFACVVGSSLAVLAGQIQVVALHPLMADLAHQVGGDRVKVVDLVGEGGNPHRFEPKPEDLRRMKEAHLILAGGKGLETYLDRVKAAVGDVTILEVGRTIPSLSVGKDEVYTCCPHHHGHSSLDPHWWHGIENMRRASRVVAQALGEKDAAGKEVYLANASAYSSRLGGLKTWAKGELSKVPRGQRKLVTAHNAFGYFGKEFGFEIIAVAGLNQEQNTAPKEQAKTIESVKKSGVKAVFPEYGSSSKSVEAIAGATGTKVGKALVADGNGTGKAAGFEGMIRHNVSAISAALVTP